MDIETLNLRKTEAELLQLALDKKLSPKEVKVKWPAIESDYLSEEAFRVLCHFEDDEVLRKEDEEYASWQISRLKKIISRLTQPEMPTRKSEAFSLREKLEKPLLEVDELIGTFAANIGARLISCYRDAVNRIIYWRDKRVVKYIGIDEVYDEDEGDALYYLVDACAYRIKLPILHFWNAYFDGCSEYRKNIGVLKAPIGRQKLDNLLSKAYQNLRQLSWTTLKEQHAKS